MSDTHTDGMSDLIVTSPSFLALRNYIPLMKRDELIAACADGTIGEADDDEFDL